VGATIKLVDNMDDYLDKIIRLLEENAFLKDATLDQIKEELIERYRKTGDNRISIWLGDTKEENSVEIDLCPENCYGGATDD
jgi:uncharacterized protein with ATP-grasp and redox domains